MSLLLLAAFSAFAAESAPPPQRHVYEVPPQRLDLDVEAGRVSVRTDTAATTLEVRFASTTECVVTREDTALRIRGCTAEVTVVTPPAPLLRVMLGTGDVALDTSNAVRVNVATGNVTGEARGRAHVTVGAGNVRLTGLTRAPVVTVATGNTELSYGVATR